MVAVTTLVLAVIAAHRLTPQEVTRITTQEVAQSTAWQNQQQLALAQRTGREGWQTLDGGLRWRRVKGNGAGPHPAVTDRVKIHYAGSFVDGTEFDSSYGGEPVTFPLDALIPAWQIAVPRMGVGDTIEIAVPAEMGYGSKGKGPIPGGATLIFRIELLGINPPE